MPWWRSPLTASNPKATPSSGAAMARKAWTVKLIGPKSTPSGSITKSARKTAGVPLAISARERIRSAAKYSGISAAIPRTMSRT